MVEGDRPHPDPAPGEPDPHPPAPPQGPESSVPPPAGPVVPPRRRRWLVLLAVGLVCLLLAAGAVWRLDGVGTPGRSLPSAAGPTDDPATVAPPPGLDLPAAPTAAAVAPVLAGDEVDRGSVRDALQGLLGDRRLGRRVMVQVAGVDGRPVLTRGPRVVTPASTLKLLTSLAALEAVGPEHRFTTRVLLSGRRLTLVGGGDPLLARAPSPGGYPEQADLATLARRAARALTDRGTTKVRLAYDDSLFSGPAASGTWEPDYLPDDVVSPVTALWVDEGRERSGLVPRSADPSLAAAEVFAHALRRRGVEVRGVPRHAEAEGGATEVAEVLSAPLVEIVQHVLEVSDNEGAEVLARQVALARGLPASFEGGARAVRRVVAALGVPLGGAATHDGSGLSRADRLPGRALLTALAVAADPEHPELAGLVAGLPVAGFSGSLSYRFGVDADPGLGFVRAKTGTLTGVHGLAGLVVARDGTVMTFVALADRVKVRNAQFARDRLDQIASALAGCACS